MTEKKDVLMKYSEKSGIPYKDVKKRYDDLYKDFGNAKQALSRLHGDIMRESGSLRSSAITWKGFIFGDSGVVDFVELMKRKAESLYKNPVTRKRYEGKLYTSDGTPLDPRKQLNFVDNPNYLGPLKGHSYSKTLYGIAGVGREMKEPKFFQMNFSDDLAIADIPYQLYTWYLFRGTKGQTDKNMYKINAKTVTNFQPTNTTISKEDETKLIEGCGYTIWKASEMEKAFMMNKDSKRKDRTDQSIPLLIKGNAREIIYTPNKNNNRRIELADEDMWSGSYTCWIPEHIPLEFGKDSPIVVVGSILKREFNDEPQYQVNANGILPLQGYFPKA